MIFKLFHKICVLGFMLLCFRQKLPRAFAIHHLTETGAWIILYVHAAGIQGVSRIEVMPYKHKHVCYNNNCHTMLLAASFQNVTFVLGILGFFLVSFFSALLWRSSFEMKCFVKFEQQIQECWHTHTQTHTQGFNGLA